MILGNYFTDSWGDVVDDPLLLTAQEYQRQMQSLFNGAHMSSWPKTKLQRAQSIAAAVRARRPEMQVKRLGVPRD